MNRRRSNKKRRAPTRSLGFGFAVDGETVVIEAPVAPLPLAVAPGTHVRLSEVRELLQSLRRDLSVEREADGTSLWVSMFAHLESFEVDTADPLEPALLSICSIDDSFPLSTDARLAIRGLVDVLRIQHGAFQSRYHGLVGIGLLPVPRVWSSLPAALFALIVLRVYVSSAGACGECVGRFGEQVAAQHRPKAPPSRSHAAVIDSIFAVVGVIPRRVDSLRDVIRLAEWPRVSGVNGWQLARRGLGGEYWRSMLPVLAVIAGPDAFTRTGLRVYVRFAALHTRDEDDAVWAEIYALHTAQIRRYVWILFMAPNTYGLDDSALLSLSRGVQRRLGLASWPEFWGVVRSVLSEEAT